MATTQDIHAPDARSPTGSRARAAARRWPATSATAWSAARGAPRRALPFRDILAARRRAAAPPAGPPRPSREGPAGAQPASALPRRPARACCAALGVGVLIGNSGGDETAATPPPAAGHHRRRRGRGAGRDRAGGDHEHAGGLDVGGRERLVGQIEQGLERGSSAEALEGLGCDKKTVKDLNSSSGADYQKKSQKLPKAVGTAGKRAAKKDNKPAGGGTGFQDIG